ncbi:MAG TPA: PKD domain-containing protein [Thermoplasmata archaeon]|nr:PKD domain-containing protein [Thermoplasmata archaeon]
MLVGLPLGGVAHPPALPGAIGASVVPPAAPSRGYQVIDYNSSVDGANLSYLEWLPAGYNSTKSYPLVVFLHGLGYDGNELLVLSGGVAAIQNASAYQFLLISINTRTLSGFYVNSPYSGPQEQDVLDAISHEETLRHVNTTQVYMFGSSMGTIGSYSIAAHHPGLLRGIGAVAECPETFMAVYYHFIIGYQDSYLTTTNGLLPNQSAQSFAETYYLDPVRYYPQNFSNVLLYAVQGGNDNRCPNNPHLFGYQQSNNTYLNSTCLIVKSWGQPANCQTPFANLSSAYPGQYLWRFDFEPTGQHTLNDLAPADMFQFWLGRLPTGLYCGTPGDPPFSCSDAPQVPAPTASPASVDVNATLALHVAPIGGSPPYTYYWRGLPRGCVSENTSTLTCVPALIGTYNVSTVVVDSNSSEGLSPTTVVVVNPLFAVRAGGSPQVGPAPLVVNFTTSMRGGTPPATAHWEFGDGAGSSLANVTHAFASTGTYIVKEWVNDSGGGAYVGTLTIEVGPLPLVATLPEPSRTSADVGQRVSFTSSASGGTAPYTFGWLGLPPGCTSSNATSLNCTPTAAGVFTVQMTARDAVGLEVQSPSLGFAVYVPPVTTGLTAARTATDIGAPVALTLSVVGGAPPLTTVWLGLPAGCASSNSLLLTCSPTDVGTYIVSASSTDSNGFVSNSSSVTLSVVERPTIVSIQGAPDPAVTGQAWTLNASLHGGTAPVTWSYEGLPAGCVSANSSTLTCTPSTGGSFMVQVIATDGAGVRAESNFSLTVSSSSPGPGLFAPPSQLVLDVLTAGVALAIVAISVMILVLWRNSRRGR